MRILIAEDDQVLADGLLRTLRAAGAAVDHVASGSEADAALMTHLAFWTGKDMPRMDRLFRMSGLGKRDKATKNDRHLDYCLKIIRSRQDLEMELDKKRG
mgnify:CR=1 FL=1